MMVLLEIALLRWWWIIIPQRMVYLSTEFETDWLKNDIVIEYICSAAKNGATYGVACGAGKGANGFID